MSAPEQVTLPITSRTTKSSRLLSTNGSTTEGGKLGAGADAGCGDGADALGTSDKRAQPESNPSPRHTTPISGLGRLKSDTPWPEACSDNRRVREVPTR